MVFEFDFHSDAVVIISDPYSGGSHNDDDESEATVGLVVGAVMASLALVTVIAVVVGVVVYKLKSRPTTLGTKGYAVVYSSCIYRRVW
jgi:hypothetical protein